MERKRADYLREVARLMDVCRKVQYNPELVDSCNAAFDEALDEILSWDVNPVETVTVRTRSPLLKFMVDIRTKGRPPKKTTVPFRQDPPLYGDW